TTKIEIEVDDLAQFKDALSGKPDIIMLDNMSRSDVRKAVSLRKGRYPLLEVSGNIDIKNIRSFASCGVDSISLGTLTKDIVSLDMSLEIKKILKKGG
ncbi:MAG: nicotinate-nucleotide diphosphorylase (carboxylating), partial [Candidatus Omnitrophica bacterium]|nr:nicotinate-nucleotide diphosphorylase (carboxylating) [Candidatus Omnitrophota bacterium]